jgi:hypothetical protein
MEIDSAQRPSVGGGQHESCGTEQLLGRMWLDRNTKRRNIGRAGSLPEDPPMLHKSLVAFAAVAVTVTAFAASADARAKKESQNVAQPSLDGRVTGRPRTCGYNYFQYDHKGVPMGPYCH